MRRCSLSRVLCILCAGLFVLAGCTKDSAFSGYWRMQPPTDSPLRLVRIADNGDGFFTVAGLWPWPSLLMKREGSTLVWRSDTAEQGRFEIREEDGTLTIDAFDSLESQPAWTAVMKKASGTSSQLQHEWRWVAAQYTDPFLRREINRLAQALESWASAHAGVYPSAGEMAPQGSFWQSAGAREGDFMNPVTRDPMIESRNPGDYSYARSPDRRGFRLSGHSISGLDYSVRAQS
jgi:hypothetical protein